MTTIGYIRVSKDDQNTKNQKIAILEYCQSEKIHIDSWIEIEMSSRKSLKKRRIDELLSTVSTGDTIIIAELSRLGRSVGQIAVLVENLIQGGVYLHSIKEGIRLNGKMDIGTKMQVTMFSLFAEIERDLISHRTKEGLARAKAEGKLLGRPKGIGKSVLDGREEEIRKLLEAGVNVTNTARVLGVGRSTLRNFMRSRGIMVRQKGIRRVTRPTD